MAYKKARGFISLYCEIFPTVLKNNVTIWCISVCSQDLVTSIHFFSLKTSNLVEGLFVTSYYLKQFSKQLIIIAFCGQYSCDNRIREQVISVKRFPDRLSKACNQKKINTFNSHLVVYHYILYVIMLKSNMNKFSHQHCIQNFCSSSE